MANGYFGLCEDHEKQENQIRGKQTLPKIFNRSNMAAFESHRYLLPCRLNSRKTRTTKNLEKFK